jgi:hypothetical protein
MASVFPSLSILMNSRKFTILPMLGDGNCFYRAVAAAYYKDIDMHHMLRRLVMEHILEDESMYSTYVDSSNKKSFRGIVNANKRLGVWNTDLADVVPVAISRTLNCRVEVYAMQGSHEISKYVFGAEHGSPIRLLLRDNHYDLLVKE